MRALMPPQAVIAIKAAKGLSAAAKRGSHVLKHFWGQLKGPGKKRLAEVLHAEAVKREADAGAAVSGWSHTEHVRDLYRPEVGLRNPFRRRKKKRRVPPMRNPVPPPQDPEPDVEESDEMDEQQGDESAGDVELAAMSPGADFEGVESTGAHT